MTHDEIKTHMWKTFIVSLLLALLLKAGLHIPFLTSIIAINIISVMHVLTQLGTGATTAEGLWENAKKLGMGIVIFLALRLLAGNALGLYPVDTYGVIDNSGGLWNGILLGRNTSKIFLWELMFALVAGGLTVGYIKDKGTMIVNTIFFVSLLILTLQIAFPTYVQTWPNRETVSTNLVHHGVVGTTAKAGWRFAFGNPEPKPATPPKVSATTAPVIPSVIDATTPARLTLDFHFRIESDAPVNIEYPGEKPVLYTPGKGFQQLPQPQQSGPKVFTDPTDPNGHVSFRIYPIR